MILWCIAFRLTSSCTTLAKPWAESVNPKLKFDISRMDLSNTRQQVVLDAKTAFYGYLAAERAVKVSEENLRLNEDLVRQAQDFTKSGSELKLTLPRLKLIYTMPKPT